MIEEPWFSIGVFVARLLMAAVFLVSGIEKAARFSRALAEYTKLSIPYPRASVLLTIFLHLLASTCLIVGWLVAEMAAALALFTFAATCLAHDFWNSQGDERLARGRVALANIALAGGLILLSVTGPGTLRL